MKQQVEIIITAIYNDKILLNYDCRVLIDLLNQQYYCCLRIRE